MVGSRQPKRWAASLRRARGVRYLLAMVAMLVADRLPAWGPSDLLRYSAMGYILLDMLLMARAGYRRRLPHWTRDSWRRYFIACATPVGALLIFVCMDAVHPAGAARSTTRAIYVGILLLFMLLGAVGLSSAIAWLALGDPTRQFTRFRRNHRLPQTPGSAA